MDKKTSEKYIFAIKNGSFMCITPSTYPSNIQDALDHLNTTLRKEIEHRVFSELEQ